MVEKTTGNAQSPQDTVAESSPRVESVQELVRLFIQDTRKEMAASLKKGEEWVDPNYFFRWLAEILQRLADKEATIGDVALVLVLTIAVVKTYALTHDSGLLTTQLAELQHCNDEMTKLMLQDKVAIAELKELLAKVYTGLFATVYGLHLLIRDSVRPYANHTVPFSTFVLPRLSILTQRMAARWPQKINDQQLTANVNKLIAGGQGVRDDIGQALHLDMSS